MNVLTKDLKQQEKEWLNYIDEAAAFLETAPEGRLRVSTSHNKYKQYLVSDRDDQLPARCARADEKELVRQLAQKEYYKKILKLLNPALLKLQDFIRQYDPDRITNLFLSLAQARKELVKPVRLPDSDFINEWLQNHAGHENSYPLSDDIQTNKGEPVRSKSEKIIADKFYELEIPYVYESSVYLNGLGTVCPDFTVLNVRTRQTFYYEHFGLMSDPDYSYKALKKIIAYGNNGFWFGDGLLYSFETENIPLSTAYLEKMIRTYLL